MIKLHDPLVFDITHRSIRRWVYYRARLDLISGLGLLCLFSLSLHPKTSRKQILLSLWGSNVAQHVLPSNRSVHNSRSCHCFPVNDEIPDHAVGFDWISFGLLRESQNGRLCRLGSQVEAHILLRSSLRGIHDFNFPTIHWFHQNNTI